MGSLAALRRWPHWVEVPDQHEGGSSLEGAEGTSPSQWLLHDDSLDQMQRGKITCVCSRLSQVQIQITISKSMKKLP